jgi:predicted transposase YdaD
LFESKVLTRFEYTSKFMANPGLLPLAVLSDTSTKDSILQSVAAQIENITNPRTQNNVMASTAILAGLVLDEVLIQRLLRRDNMRESVIYQSILQEGADEKERQIVINLLKAGASLELITQVTGLTVEQIQQIQAEQEENQQE